MSLSNNNYDNPLRSDDKALFFKLVNACVSIILQKNNDINGLSTVGEKKEKITRPIVKYPSFPFFFSAFNFSSRLRYMS